MLLILPPVLASHCEIPYAGYLPPLGLEMLQPPLRMNNEHICPSVLRMLKPGLEGA